MYNETYNALQLSHLSLQSKEYACLHAHHLELSESWYATYCIEINPILSRKFYLRCWQSVGHYSQGLVTQAKHLDSFTGLIKWNKSVINPIIRTCCSSAASLVFCPAMVWRDVLPHLSIAPSNSWKKIIIYLSIVINVKHLVVMHCIHPFIFLLPSPAMSPKEFVNSLLKSS